MKFEIFGVEENTLRIKIELEDGFPTLFFVDKDGKSDSFLRISRGKIRLMPLRTFMKDRFEQEGLRLDEGCYLPTEKI